MKLILVIVGIVIVAAYGALEYSGLGPRTEQPPEDSAAETADASRVVEPAAAPRAEPAPPPEFIPAFFTRSFPITDWTNANQRLQNALSGGPSKDGIPAIDTPTFIPLASYDRSDDVQAIVLEDSGQTKVYPYNILTWHEIVNDTVAGQPVAVTFCPLCGSAIVFDRMLHDGSVSTFGVSGGLLESNMIMYDRETESLWQQSTGESLAGTHVGARLAHVPFQLLTLGEVRNAHPNALVLSENTGHNRDYARNPYSGYEEDHTAFYFPPSDFDTRFPQKEIMVVVRDGDTVLTTPWAALRTSGNKTASVASQSYTFTVTAGELTVTDDAGTVLPFYFEMWFSVAVQYGEDLVVVK